LHWTHPDIDDVMVALAAVDANEVTGALGAPMLRIELIDASNGSSMLTFDGSGAA
jgi:hypothetical protein